MTREPDFYQKLYENNSRGDDTKMYQLFVVQFGNAKKTEETQLHQAAPALKYHQKSFNSRFFSSLS